jgi:YD repeat-containing protein
VLGRLKLKTVANRYHTTYAYNGMDRLTHEATVDDITSWSTEKANVYLPDGRLDHTINGLGMTTKYNYEPKTNRLETVVAQGVKQPDGNTKDVVTKYEYDENNNVVLETVFRDGYQEPVVTEYSYDALNRRTMTRVFASPGMPGVTSIVEDSDYDLVGNLISQTDVHNNTTSFTFDGMYRVLHVTIPVQNLDGTNPVTETIYDGVGNKLFDTDGNGHTVAYQYYEDHRSRWNDRVLLR